MLHLSPMCVRGLVSQAGRCSRGMWDHNLDVPDRVCSSPRLLKMLSRALNHGQIDKASVQHTSTSSVQVDSTQPGAGDR
jgi:hypothetical protein